MDAGIGKEERSTLSSAGERFEVGSGGVRLWEMERSTGTVIRLTKLTESSLIVHWLTAENGLIKTVAKGARGRKSAFAGKLDLFVEAELIWRRARTSELHALTDLDVLSYREGLRASYGQTVTATYFCQLLERFVEPQTEVPELYDLLQRGLSYLEEKLEVKGVAHFERQLAQLAGVGEDGRALKNHLGDLPATRKQIQEILGEW